MAKSNQSGGTLAANVDVTSGLQAFRSIATGPTAVIDSPFGRPAAAPPAPTVAIAEGVNEPPKVQQIEATAKPVRKPTSRPKVASEPEDRQGEELIDANEEKITVPLSLALRDQSEELARVINRSRSVRKDRITRNSIIRVALQCFLEEFSPPPGRPVNSELELLEAARSRRKK